MTKARLLIVGAGKIGTRVAEQLRGSFNVTLLSRHPSARLSPDNQEGIGLISADLCAASNELEASISNGYEFVLFCVSAKERNAESYQALYVDAWDRILRALNPRETKRVFFVSSSSVYAQDDGVWVDEQSICEPESFSGRCMLAAEAVPGHLGFAHTNIRFTGIYGGMRSRLIDQVKSGAVSLSSETRLTNRIHEDDCVGFICHLLRAAERGSVLESLYLATDDCPVDLNEVYQFIAEQQGVALGDMSGVVQARRRAGSKRCSNALMKQTGYRLVYPSYREGYAN